MTLCMTNELKEVLGRNLAKLESPSLRLSKYVSLDKNDKELKRKEINAVVAIHNQHSKINNFIHPNAHALYMKLGGRLIVNQAGGVLENAGLCLDRNFGFPYIPGSAVKGCARHYAWEQWQAMDVGELKNDYAKKIAFIFGFPTNEVKLDQDLKNLGLKEQAGSVSFLRATPYEKPRLEVDILTCHHPKYYRGEQEKALGNEGPNPLPFPVVGEGGKFVFQLVALEDGVEMKFVSGLLQEALEINGIGAKTAAGYGWFVNDKYITDQKEKERLAKIAQKQEYDRQSQMTPEQREFDKLSKLDQTDFIEVIKELESKENKQQKLILEVLINQHLKLWSSDNKDLQKAEKKGKSPKKAGERAKIVRDVAKEIGFKLP